MSKVNKKRIWNTEELTCAYYVSKYGTLNGLKMTKEELVDYVIGDTTERSFDMQVANFNYIMGVGEYQLEDTSKAQRELVDSLTNKTVTQVREIILTYAEKIDDEVSARRTAVANKSANSKVEELNAEMEKNFQAKLQMLKLMGRNLTPVKK